MADFPKVQDVPDQPRPSERQDLGVKPLPQKRFQAMMAHKRLGTNLNRQSQQQDSDQKEAPQYRQPLIMNLSYVQILQSEDTSKFVCDFGGPFPFCALRPGAIFKRWKDKIQSSKNKTHVRICVPDGFCWIYAFCQLVQADAAFIKMMASHAGKDGQLDLPTLAKYFPFVKILESHLDIDSLSSH